MKANYDKFRMNLRCCIDTSMCHEHDNKSKSNGVVDLTRVGGQMRVSDVNADERSPYDAGSDTKLPARI
jgi:hypothetical protein